MLSVGSSRLRSRGRGNSSSRGCIVSASNRGLRLLVLLLAASALAVIAGSVAGAMPVDPGNGPNCPNPNVIQGTNGPDVLIGTPGNDLINGGGGNDVIDGRDGNDCVFGGNDADIVQGDRKSTRLNSSHQIISYAVFCLKKKTRRCKISQ